MKGPRVLNRVHGFLYSQSVISLEFLFGPYDEYKYEYKNTNMLSIKTLNIYNNINFIKKESTKQVFSCEFCKSLRTPFYKTPLVASSPYITFACISTHKTVIKPFHATDIF